MREGSKPIEANSIANISYVHTTLKSYAFVFYETAEGTKNLVITRNYSVNGELEYESASSCSGTDCACEVKATIDNNGNVTVGCSCSTCVMISTP